MHYNNYLYFLLLCLNIIDKYFDNSRNKIMKKITLVEFYLFLKISKDNLQKQIHYNL